jgi:RinA family phage transcriptional activator
MRHHKPSKAAFRHIEAELYYYHDTVKEIENIRKEILLASPVKQEGKPSGVSDPTFNIVTRLTMDKRLKKLEEITESITHVLNLLDRTSSELIKLKYFSKPQYLTWDGIAQKVNFSKRQCIYIRDNFIAAVAERLGWR